MNFNLKGISANQQKAIDTLVAKMQFNRNASLPFRGSGFKHVTLQGLVSRGVLEVVEHRFGRVYEFTEAGEEYCVPYPVQVPAGLRYEIDYAAVS